MRLTKKIIATALVMVLSSVMLLSGCGSQSATESAGDLTKVTIGFDSWVGYGPFFIAKEKGFFEKYGIDAELKLIEDSSQYQSLMASDSLQVIGHVVDQEGINFSKGMEAQIVAGIDYSYGADGLVASKEIQTVQDLKGKTIALNTTSSSYFFFLYILNANGLKTSDLTIKHMMAGDAGAAFVAGQVDAAITWEPWLSKAKERDGGHVLVSSTEYPESIVDAIMVSKKLIDEKPEVVAGLVKAWIETIEYYKANVDEGNQIIADGFGYPVEDVENGVKGIKFFGKAENMDFMSKNGEFSVYNIAENVNKYYTAEKVIDAPFNIDEFINPTFVQEATK